jgi:hypothetical protein
MESEREVNAEAREGKETGLRKGMKEMMKPRRDSWEYVSHPVI